ncbi:NAD-dependent epimerase/dehydratase family protein [Anaerocolumna sp. AGMB13025]|uniref:NAD-dependent epimerase/dehydratase family protein n=1 Tax=Anaerocolumna sp. AGMB13025 TaxID=3039116 RepID=UPI00241D64FF|nr:NAD-dependent epimerase/dehydratase family protein [Anaerocolumna sp. AGMB13025]WFR56324.1 NAD-dependent epimerase/dehydratase family protein [Anaerocolumna sp. AGMB13025]
MKKVLVIGANSYIGRKFREYVLQECEYELTVDLVSAFDGSWRMVDFTCYDVILHLAAIVHKKETKGMEALYYDVNHKLALEAARKAKESQINQFIFMSTAAVFGPSYECITKETKPRPVTFYGKSKLLAESEILKLQDEKYRIAIVRPPMVYGDGCKGNYEKLVKLARYTPVFPEYHNKRSMLYIDNLSKYLVELIRNESNGIYHPQDGDYADTCEVIVKIRKEMGKRTKLTPYFNAMIGFFIKNNISVLKKMFGDLYYDKSLV